MATNLGGHIWWGIQILLGTCNVLLQSVCLSRFSFHVVVKNSFSSSLSCLRDTTFSFPFRRCAGFTCKSSHCTKLATRQQLLCTCALFYLMPPVRGAIMTSYLITNFNTISCTTAQANSWASYRKLQLISACHNFKSFYWKIQLTT